MDFNEYEALIEPVIFECDSKTYVYEFNQLEVEQAELAREAGEFKNNLQERGADNFTNYSRSKAPELNMIILSYLVKERNNDKVLPFDRGKAETEIIKALGKMNVKNIENMNKVIIDFFSNIGQQQTGFKLLRNSQKRSGIEMLLPIFRNLDLGKMTKDELSKTE